VRYTLSNFSMKNIDQAYLAEEMIEKEL